MRRYCAHAACLVVGLTLGFGGASVVAFDDDGSHGLADQGCVHITTSATICGHDAHRVCSRISVELATARVDLGKDVKQTDAVQVEECRKVY